MVFEGGELLEPFRLLVFEIHVECSFFHYLDEYGEVYERGDGIPIGFGYDYRPVAQVLIFLKDEAVGNPDDGPGIVYGDGGALRSTGKQCLTRDDGGLSRAV